MHGLISQDILSDILATTGAYEDLSGDRHVFKGGDFKRFFFNVRKRAEFNYASMNIGLDSFASVVERIWDSYGLSGQNLSHRIVKNVDPHGYKFRETSFCTQLFQQDCDASPLMYYSNKEFYHLMNIYMGGRPTDAFKVRTVLTDIESIFFAELSGRLARNFSMALKYLALIDLKPIKFGMDEIDQIRVFSKKYIAIEFIRENTNEPVFSILLPEAFLQYLMKAMDEMRDSENRKLNPIWKQVVTQVVLNSHIDFNLSIGQLQIPFSKSFNLQVGDVFDWNKTDSKVRLRDEVGTRVVGEMGVVGENYAIKVEEVFK